MLCDVLLYGDARQHTFAAGTEAPSIALTLDPTGILNPAAHSSGRFVYVRHSHEGRLYRDHLRGEFCSSTDWAMSEPNAAMSPDATGSKPDTVHVAWRGDKRYSVSRPGAPSIILDGARDAGPGPVEGLLGALAACAAMDVIDYLVKRRTPASRLEVVVDGVRRASSPRRVLSVKLDFEIDGDSIDAEHAERGIALALGTYCSVAATLSPEVAIAARLVLNGVARSHVAQQRVPRTLI